MKSHNYSCRVITILASLAVLAFAPVPSAQAASILFVSDVESDHNIPLVLVGDGHTVTTVLNDYSSGDNPTLSADLSAYGAVFWSATGNGAGGTHNAPTFINLANYVSAGGRVFVTGYDSIASPTDSELISFLGGTGSFDLPSEPTAVINVVNSLTTGVVDIRGITPTGGYGDRDALTGLNGDTVGVVATSGSPTQFQWTLRTLGAGEVAYVSNGASGSSSAHPSWEDTSPGGAGAYNAALRNFASAAITDDLTVTPTEGFDSIGYEGGPFTPSAKDYTLTNTGPNSLDWTAGPNVPWLDVEPNTGTLLSDQNIILTVSINDDANSLAVGTHNGRILFTNLTSGVQRTRAVTLTVAPPPPPPSNPNPADDANMVEIDTLLSWNNPLLVKTEVLTGVSSTTPVRAAQDTRLSYESPLPIANVAIFQNSNPWGNTRNQDILTANGFSYTIYGSASMGVVDLSGYDKVIISSVQDSGFYTQLQANIDWFEDYVMTGGILDVHAATQGDQPALPGGFGITHSASDAVTIVDSDHPVVTTPHTITDAELDGWNASVHGYISVVPTGAQEILEVTASGQPCAMDLNFGLGRIFVTTQTVEWTGASYNYLENTILYEVTSGGVTYDVYFDTNDPPVILIHSDLTTTSCTPVPHPLDYETTYYWQVVATNPGGQTPGPVWSFTTIGPPGEIEVTDSIPPVDDLNMPFGDVIIGLTRTEQITLANIDPNYWLTITGIALGNVQYAPEMPRLSAALPAVSSHSISSSDSYLPAGWVSPERLASELVVPAGYEMLNGQVEVLLLASGPGVSILQTGLAAFPDIDTVDYFDCSLGTPTEEILNAYDVVVVMSNTPFYNAVGTGDVLADYVDNEGKVIQAVASFATGGGWELAGRFVTADYEPFGHGPAEFIPHSLGDFDDTHPIMDGVTTLTDELPAAVTLKPQADWIASWDNDVPLVATRNDNVVGINIFAFDSGNFTGDVVLLFHNAVVWLTRGTGFSLTNVPSIPIQIPPSESIDINVVFAPTELGERESSVLITSSDPNNLEVEVQLTGAGILDYLDVSPSAPVQFSGHPGGPFIPSKILYTLQNNNLSQTISWSATKTADWIDVSPLDGSIVAGGSAAVTVKPNSMAMMLPEGDYNDVLLFTNLTTTVQHNREILLNVYTAPKIWTDPPPEDGFSVTVRQGETLTETLTIGNTGDANLSLELSVRQVQEPLAALSPVAELESSEEQMVFEYFFDKPTTEKLQDYDLLKMDGLELYEQTAAPIVPVRPVEILVPYGKQVVDCQVTVEQIQELPGSFLLPPAQRPYPLSYKGTIEPTPADQAIYAKATSWPGEYYEEVGIQSKRGYQLFILNLFPLQYAPATGKVSYASTIVLTVTLEDAQQTSVVMPSDPVKEKLTNSVDNPAALETYPAVAKLEGSNAALTLPPGGPYVYVIITSQALKDAPGPWNFQALRDAKTADGIPATIITTEWIYANYDGTKPSGGSDNQTKIRNFLIDAYQNWATQYVLLGGTDAIVPARLFWVDSLAGEIDYMPVDMYYGCVEPAACTFDYDADNNYGEPSDGVGGGEVDLFAEIYVGRATVESATELANFVGKTLTYDMTDEDYLPRIAMVGEHLGFGGVAEYATEAMEQIRTGGYFDGYYTCGFEDHNQPGFIDFNTIECMPADPCCCWPLYDAPGYDWPIEKLLCLMNNGIHCFNHLGHANYTYCMKLYTSDLSLLTNDDYFFAYSQGCMPGGFDTANCFAEVITSMEHGAFGVVMNARYGWGTFNSTDGPSHRYARQFWDATLGEGVLEIGRANHDSKEDNAWNINSSCMRWIYYELNLFGDPAQQFRFSEGVDWLELMPDAGTVPPDDAMDVNVVFMPGSLDAGTYYGQLIINSNDFYTPRITVPLTMTVERPQEWLISTGVVGGPFKPASKNYTFTNDGNEPMEWQADATVDWLDVEPNNGIIDPCSSQIIEVAINNEAAALDPAVYTGAVDFTNLTADVTFTRPVTLKVVIRDFFTELFDAGDNDLQNLSLTLMPHPSGHFYTACIEPVSCFPVYPTGGTVLTMGDDDYNEITLGDGKLIPFYGQLYDTFYVGSNGYITFDTGDILYIETLEDHFLYKRVSALFDDLDPSAGGTVSWKQLPYRVVVTYEDVPEHSLQTTNSFQILMAYDGKIRIVWLNIDAQDGLAGISDGNGLDTFFVESDISRYGSCITGDFDYNGEINSLDLRLFAQSWLYEECSPADGYCDGCDPSRDGLVNFIDYGTFADGWFDMP